MAATKVQHATYKASTYQIKNSLSSSNWHESARVRQTIRKSSGRYVSRSGETLIKSLY